MPSTPLRLTGSFVLPEDVQLQPAAELGEELRRSSGADDGDFALSRKNSRSHSKIIDAEGVRLLRHFEKPSTIARAVARFIRTQSGTMAQEPESILEEALPLLRSLIGEGLLVESGSDLASPTVESLAAGDRVDDWLVARCIQSLEDTELYLVSNSDGQWGALKIGRPEDIGARIAIEREAELLAANTSTSFPRLLAISTWRERPYLITEWFSGIDAETAAVEIRKQNRFTDEHESPRDLHRLGAAILDAYAELHESGLLHGDIHPRNLLVDGRGQVKILDFGVASRLGEPNSRGGGVSFYLEPEFAQAALNDLPPPPATFAAEQYAVAALLYLLITGAHTQDFNLERREMLTQIATGAVIPFAKRGLEPWPEAEQVLVKALSKNPTERYASISELARAWRQVEPPARLQAAIPERRSKLSEIRQKFLSKSAIGGEWWRDGFQTGATAPVNNGAAGLAYALHRIAGATGDGELHAAADAWSVRAIRDIDSPKAVESETAEPGALKPGLASLYHHRPGVYAAQALLASARGDVYVLNRAVSQFVAWGGEALDEVNPAFDLTLGFAGSLLGSALLLDCFAESGLPREMQQTKAELLLFGHALSARLWAVLDGFAPIGESPREGNGLDDTGVAHGWAGIFYAALQWQAAAQTAPPPALLARLDQLAARAEPAGRGLHWPWGTRVSYPGWCNGSAGQIFLWTAAHKATGESRYLDLAEGAAWNTWESPSRYSWLCCGLTGQAYALLNFHRHSGDAVWLRRAVQMAEWAAEAASVSGQTGDSPSETRPGSLYNGITGLAVLDADLERPLDARMPFFERD